MLHDSKPRGDGSTCEAIDIQPGIPTTETPRGLSELEEKVARQHQLLSEATRFLHEAAYLARYHQPSLEREIRTFLNQIPEPVKPL